MKKFFVIILCLFILFGILFLGRANVLKKTIVFGTQYVLGAPVKIGGIDIDKQEGTITLKDFKLFNPQGFAEGVLMTADEIKLTYHNPVIINWKIHLLQVIIKFDEIVVVKRKDGKLNVDSLKGVQDPSNIPQLSDHEEYDDNKRIHIDTFILSVNRVVYKDYAKAGAVPEIEVFDVNIKDKTYQDIPGVQMLVLFALKQAMAETAIKGAAIYGVEAVAGIGFWPAGVAVIVLGNDSAQGIFKKDYDIVFQACVDTLMQEGHITSQDKGKGNIEGTAHGATVSIEIKKSGEKIKVVVSARKVMLLPNPKQAKTLLYVISEHLTGG